MRQTVYEDDKAKSLNEALGWTRWVGTSRNGFPLDELTFHKRETHLREHLTTFTTIPGCRKSCTHFLWRNTLENSTDTYQKLVPPWNYHSDNCWNTYLLSTQADLCAGGKQARAICLQGEPHTGLTDACFLEEIQRLKEALHSSLS